MQKHILGIAMLGLIFSSCCEDTGTLLLNVALPDDTPVACDNSKATTYQNSYNLKEEMTSPVFYPKDNTTGLYLLQDGLAWYNVSSNKLLAQTSSAVALKAFSNTESIYSYENLVCAASATGVVVVDMMTQQIAWERNLPDCTLNGSNFSGLGNKYFAVGHTMDSEGKKCEAIYATTLETSEDFGLFLTPKYSRQYYNSWCGYGRVTEIKAFKGANAEEFLLVSFLEPVDEYKLLNFVGLYNLSRQKWEYERAPLNQKPGVQGVFSMSFVSDIARMPLGDSIFVWDVMAGQLKSKIAMPFGGYGKRLIAGRIWSNQSATFVNTNESEFIAFDNASNHIIYRLSNLNSAFIQVELEQNLFLVPSADYCQVFDLSSGQAFKPITAPCQNDAPAKFLETYRLWETENGAFKIALQSGTTVYEYDIVK